MTGIFFKMISQVLPDSSLPPGLVDKSHFIYHVGLAFYKKNVGFSFYKPNIFYGMLCKASQGIYNGDKINNIYGHRFVEGNLSETRCIETC